ncbi:MAG: adenylate/guanylate cyclase domain-containing protein [Alphaproteobacteria bacterium]
MPRHRVLATTDGTKRSAWVNALVNVAEMGTGGYPPLVRRRLMIVNVMAYLIAIFSMIYAVLFTVFGLAEYFSLVAANLILVVVALLAPLAHRFSDISAALIIAGAEYVALFFFVRTLGHDSGIQINYMVAAAVPFAIFGLSRLYLVISTFAVGLALHMLAWFLYPLPGASIPTDPYLLNNLYVSSVVSTGCIIAVIVLYAFSLAEDARAEADALLANMLPESIAERLKASPGELLSDNVANASVLFTDLVGFTPLARELGAERTVTLLDDIITEFDDIAARHGVEKIKTIGDGYMAVSGVTVPLPDHELRLARMALELPAVIENLSEMRGMKLQIRIGMASGPVMAGVIGTMRFSYDVWGETVNLASRLESHGQPGKVHVSGEVKRALEDAFDFEPQGRIEIKGVGPLETWFLRQPKTKLKTIK